MADTRGNSSNEEVARLLAAASEDARTVLNEVAKIERATLQQKNRNKSAISRQIADAVKRGVT